MGGSGDWTYGDGVEDGQTVESPNEEVRLLQRQLQMLDILNEYIIILLVLLFVPYFFLNNTPFRRNRLLCLCDIRPHRSRDMLFRRLGELSFFPESFFCFGCCFCDGAFSLGFEVGSVGASEGCYFLCCEGWWYTNRRTRSWNAKLGRR